MPLSLGNVARPGPHSKVVTKGLRRIVPTVLGVGLPLDRTQKRALLVLSFVLALESADVGTIGAIAVQLERALHASQADIGLLLTASTMSGLVTTLPFGALVDRINRSLLLQLCIIVWAAAMIASACASSFLMLLLTRIGLGAVVAVSGPAVYSLTGDFFSNEQRGRVWGVVLSGQLLGSGFGFAVAGNIAGFLGWRWAFVTLASLSIALVGGVRYLLHEPARGGRAEPHASPSGIAPSDAEFGAVPATVGAPDDPLHQALEEEGIAPDTRLVLRRNPDDLTTFAAVRYILRIRTNVTLIAASSIGYFFFAGIETFAIEFARGRFALGQLGATLLAAVVGAGALAGTLLGGRLADRLIRDGHHNARIVLPAAAYVFCAAVFVPALMTRQLWIAAPLLALAGAALAVSNPPLDAARLDVMPPLLWGRAEGVRTVLRTALVAVAPALFGFVADELGGEKLSHGQTGMAAARLGAGSVVGLDRAFLIMLAPLAASGAILWFGRHSYLVDVASASAAKWRRRGTAVGASNGRMRSPTNEDDVQQGRPSQFKGAVDHEAGLPSKTP